MNGLVRSCRAIHTYYQPIQEVRSRELFAHESLARWRTSQGVLMANEVIRFGLELGISQALNIHLWEYAVRHSPGNRISINASPLDITEQLSDLFTLLEYAQGTKKVLIIEVAQPPNRNSEQERLSRAIARLRNAGALVWATDRSFGVSVPEHVLALCPDGIKIDCGNPRARLGDFLESKVQQIHEHNATAIAEKVDSQQSWQQVRRADFDYVQGFFVGKPTPGTPMQPPLTGGTLA
ncbi:MAG: EAL domain-containing protein [Cyanobacteria bacterium P01_F01_bin.153]